MTTTEKTAKEVRTQEARVRRMARRKNMSLEKSHARLWENPNTGKYRVIDPLINTVVYGCGNNAYEATLDQCESFLKD